MEKLLLKSISLFSFLSIRFRLDEILSNNLTTNSNRVMILYFTSMSNENVSNSTQAIYNYKFYDWQ